MASFSLYTFTYNCGKSFIDAHALSSQIFFALSSELPDLVVLSLQEIAPIPISLIGGSSLLPYYDRFHHAVQDAASNRSGIDAPTYTHIVTRNLGTTAVLVFAKDPSMIRDIETAVVGVGLWQIGNKGAAAVRLKYQHIELTFVAAHLTAMEWELSRRNEDWKNIVMGLVFSPTAIDKLGDERPLLSVTSRDASIYKPTSHLFVAGDLNYRTSNTPPAPNEHIDHFPQPHYSPNHQNHYLNLLKSDQLNRERLAGRTCHGLIEPDISFPPTYKYYTDKNVFITPDKDVAKWHWARHRWPSWCDRILYLDAPAWLRREHPEAKITASNYKALSLLPTSDHRPVVLEFKVPLLAIPDPDGDEDADDPRIHPPFQIDINWKSRRARARTLEILVGWALWLTTVREGGAVLLATALGIVGAAYLWKTII